jgi:excisionase family DNA binding protein
MTTVHGGALSADVARLAEAVIADPSRVMAVTVDLLPTVLAAVVVQRARVDTAILALAVRAATAHRKAEPAADDGLMTPREFAAAAGLGLGTVYEQMRSGRIPFKPFGRAKRIPRSALNVIDPSVSSTYSYSRDRRGTPTASTAARPHTGRMGGAARRPRELDRAAGAGRNGHQRAGGPTGPAAGGPAEPAV